MSPELEFWFSRLTELRFLVALLPALLFFFFLTIFKSEYPQQLSFLYMTIITGAYGFCLIVEYLESKALFASRL